MSTKTGQEAPDALIDELILKTRRTVEEGPLSEGWRRLAGGLAIGAFSHGVALAGRSISPFGITPFVLLMLVLIGASRLFRDKPAWVAATGPLVILAVLVTTGAHSLPLMWLVVAVDTGHGTALSIGVYFKMKAVLCELDRIEAGR